MKDVWLAVRGQLFCVGNSLLWIWDHSVGWVLKWVLIALIRAYQMVISPVLPPSCRFYPSCSAYGLESVRVHGSAKGLILAVWRLLRCNPWNGGGVDPVPLPGRWRTESSLDG